MLTAASFIACGDDKGKEGENGIQLAPGVSKNISLHADETLAAAKVSFTARGPWRAALADSRAGVDWITVTPDHGDAAGAYTVEITTGVNTSGADRKATLTITCGSAEVRIAIEQKATTAEGEIPGQEPEDPAPAERMLVSKVESFFEKSGSERVTMEFTYDDRNRLTAMKETSFYGSSSEIYTVTYEYGDGTIRIATTFSYPDGETEDFTKSYTAYLNEKGLVTRTERPGEEHATTYTYDSEDRLIRVEQPGEWMEILWENGNVVRTRYCGNGGTEPTEVTDFTYYEEMENRENIDLHSGRYSWDEALVFAGVTGVRSRHLLRQGRGSSESAHKDDLDITSCEVDKKGYLLRFLESAPAESGQDNPRRYEITHVAAK